MRFPGEAPDRRELEPENCCPLRWSTPLRSCSPVCRGQRITRRTEPDARIGSLGGPCAPHSRGCPVARCRIKATRGQIIERTARCSTWSVSGRTRVSRFVARTAAIRTVVVHGDLITKNIPMDSEGPVLLAAGSVGWAEGTSVRGRVPHCLFVTGAGAGIGRWRLARRLPVRSRSGSGPVAPRGLLVRPASGIEELAERRSAGGSALAR